MSLKEQNNILPTNISCHKDSRYKYIYIYLHIQNYFMLNTLVSLKYKQS